MFVAGGAHAARVSAPFQCCADAEDWLRLRPHGGGHLPCFCGGTIVLGAVAKEPPEIGAMPFIERQAPGPCCTCSGALVSESWCFRAATQPVNGPSSSLKIR